MGCIKIEELQMMRKLGREQRNTLLYGDKYYNKKYEDISHYFKYEGRKGNMIYYSIKK